MEIISEAEWNEMDSWSFCSYNANYSPEITSSSICKELIIHKICFDTNLTFTSYPEYYKINFKTGTKTENLWCVKIHNNYSSNCLTLSLCLLSPLPNSSGIRINIWPNKMGFPPLDNMLRQGEYWQIKFFNEYKISERKYLKFEIKIFEEIESHSYDLGERPEIDYFFSKDYDVYFWGNGWEYRAHREVLSKSSPVFQAMFLHEMKETSGGKVNITEFKGETVLAMLQFMYTGKVNNITQISEDLYKLAHKYEIDKLKLICLSIISQELSTESVLKHLYMSEMYDLKELRQICLNFIQNNLKEVIKSNEWNNLEQTSSPLSCSIIRHLAGLDIIDHEINSLN